MCTDRRKSALTAGEEELLHLAGRGLSDPMIADALGITPSALRVRWARIRRKTGSATRDEAMSADAPGRQSSLGAERRSLLDEIARRKHAEEALKLGEARHLALVDAALEGIVMTEGDKIVLVNASLEQMTGFAREELLGRNPSEFTDERGRKVLASARATRGERSTRFEIPFARKDGTEAWLSIAATPLPAVDGVTRGSLAVVVDVTEQKRLREALERQYLEVELERRRLQAVLDVLPAGVWVRAADGSIELCNSAFLQLVADEGDLQDAMRHVATIPLSDATTGERFTRERMPAERILAGEERVYGLEVFVDSLGGRRKRALVSAAAVRDSDGNIAGVVGSATDITELASLRASEERFAKAFRSNPAVIVITRRRDGLFIEANDEIRNMLLYDPEEIVGKTTAELSIWANPEDRQDLLRRLDERGWIRDAEYRFRRKDGQIVVGRYSAETIEIGGDSCILALVSDVTATKRAEEALRESEARYKSLTEAVTDYICSVPVSDGVAGDMSHSPGCFAVTGYTEAEFQADPTLWIGMVPEPDRAAVLAHERSVVAGEDAPAIEHRLRRKDGAERWVRKTCVPRRDERGRVVAYDGLIQDITERKAAEDALRKAHDELEARVLERTKQLAAANGELEAFSYSVSHDLRAPLRSIDGFSRILLHELAGIEDPETRDYLERICRAAGRMGDLIDGMLRLSRVARGEMRRDPVDLSALAQAIASELREAAPSRSAVFQVEAGLHAIGDRALLTSLMRNLLENAWKYTSKRSEARIEFGRTSDRGLDCFFVRDNGVGFDPSHAGDLFAPFHRLHDGAEFPGVGVGLSTVQRIVHRHGGEIWADSQVGRGATFCFTLPDP